MTGTTSTAFHFFSHDQQHKTDAAKWKGGCVLTTRQRGGWDSNPRPIDRKFGILPLSHRAKCVEEKYATLFLCHGVKTQTVVCRCGCVQTSFSETMVRSRSSMFGGDGASARMALGSPRSRTFACRTTCSNELLYTAQIRKVKVMSACIAPTHKGKGKASSLDIAPLTVLNSSTLQPRKWQLTGNDCSTAAHTVAAQSLR